ncbi:MAG: SagB/ThcOx family dehydrogenase [Candidatus Riflebacteria bacterium]|nr:SagB/ThcOx family dehydrogenase [Candidatus Riflebacteria bacterium]
MNTEGIGDRFQKESGYGKDRSPAPNPSKGKRPAPYKVYEGVQVVTLPRPQPPPGMAGLHEALSGRRSLREYSSRPLTLDQLSYLLWASNGIQGRRQGELFRTVPSAGALYPIETYVVVNNVEQLVPGVYHHAVRAHALEQLKSGPYGDAVVDAALGQRMCGTSAVTLIWTAVFDRSRSKYGDRAYRYIYLDAGHVAQNLALTCCSLGLGSCPIGALYDDQMNKIVDVDGEDESVVYMSTVGHPR